jgi:hypothetical protein
MVYLDFRISIIDGLPARKTRDGRIVFKPRDVYQWIQDRKDEWVLSYNSSPDDFVAKRKEIFKLHNLSDQKLNKIYKKMKVLI